MQFYEMNGQALDGQSKSQYAISQQQFVSNGWLASGGYSQHQQHMILYLDTTYSPVTIHASIKRPSSLTIEVQLSISNDSN